MTAGTQTRTRPGAPARTGPIRPSLRLEKTLLRDGCLRLAAMDEVGRGALAGPVTIGVVVVTERIGRVPEGLRDSKLLTPAARESLIAPIRRWAKEFAVGHASAVEIDAIGIMAALRAAAQRALAQLPAVDAILLDGKHDYLAPPRPVADSDQPSLFGEPRGDQFGDQFGDEFGDQQTGELPVDQIPIVPAARSRPPVHLKVKADLTCAAVAGASVLAKTERDRLLTRLDPYFPEYAFAVNKGYGTPEHLAAIRAVGPSAVHRRSWRLVGDDGVGSPEDQEEMVTR